MKITEKDVLVPLDVPRDARDDYIQNYLKITQNSGNLMLFAGDQKIEHLNDDFCGKGIPADDNDPEHLFKIAAGSRIGVFATQLGLIARYGMDYPKLPYLVKMNSKTHLVKTEQDDPYSGQLYDMEQIAEFKENSGLDILGIGYTIYLGSEYEADMLTEAAQLIYEAHQYGLITVLWIYPRGKAVADEKDSHLIAGATGVGACLNSDFVKVNSPKSKDGTDAAVLLQEAVKAAGRTKVVCAGGSSAASDAFIKELYKQIHTGGVCGNATGRNIHQKSLDEAIRMCNAVYAITVEGAGIDEALKILEGK
ncbi:Fructose-bisphosphate aldolase class 1 [Methanosarcinaceae archaeon Ag5]|uniref:fructose-bisphosphate aldolase n=1 Tax=Methanolapillus africanus TaxID=3028297 RepID=A0AAE4MK99_9EURY|nr:Fructose-bisphosphate aldolase class 1 [Methanosarcinaceae archaeon Ag5]